MDCLVQQEYNEPWMVLVSSVLLNKTKGVVVRRILVELFARWRTAEDLAAADIDDLSSVLKPCGLQNRKAKTSSFRYENE